MIIGGNRREPESVEAGGFSAAEVEEAELVIDENPVQPGDAAVESADNPSDTVDIENGFGPGCDTIEIGETSGESIEIFVREEVAGDGEAGPPDLQGGGELQYHEQEDGELEMAGEISLELFDTTEEVSLVDENNSNTDGDIFTTVYKTADKCKKIKTVTFKETEEVGRPRRWKQTKLRLKVEDGCQNLIENLPSLPDTEDALPETPTEKSPKKSPKKESPILEHRKPGRPRTTERERPKLQNGLTRYKLKAAEWKASEMFKCGVCGKVLSCRGSYERHSRMHADTKPYQCSFCPKTFREACKKVSCAFSICLKRGIYIAVDLIKDCFVPRLCTSGCTPAPNRSRASSAAKVSAPPLSALCTCAPTPR